MKLTAFVAVAGLASVFRHGSLLACASSPPERASSMRSRLMPRGAAAISFSGSSLPLHSKSALLFILRVATLACGGGGEVFVNLQYSVIRTKEPYETVREFLPATRHFTGQLTAGILSSTALSLVLLDTPPTPNDKFTALLNCGWCFF